MKRVLLDENLPRQLARELTHHEATTVRDLGLEGIQNGALLNAVEAKQFESFLTGDKNLRFQNRIEGRSFSVLVLSVTNWQVLRVHVAEISRAIDKARPGTATQVYCGTSVRPRRNVQLEPNGGP